VIARPLPRQRRRSDAGVWLLVAGALLVAPHIYPTKAPAAPAPHGRRPAATSNAPVPSDMAGRAVAYARAQLGKPYVRGDEGPAAFDCSGLTWAAWRYAGLAWRRMTAADQWRTLRRHHADRATLQPGDLVFYADNAGDWRSIHHVAVYAGHGQMIEAPYPGALVRQVPLRTRGWFGAARPTVRGGR
jgi:cell wall-associated NlpC family hydrolase